MSECNDPKFCMYCGLALVDKPFISGYDCMTGAPREFMRRECPDSQPSASFFITLWLHDRWDQLLDKTGWVRREMTSV